MRLDTIDLDEQSGQPSRNGQERCASVVLAPEATSSSAARTFVRSMLDTWGWEDPEEVAELLTSEIVNNAVRHAASTIRLEVGMDEAQLSVRARDEAPDAVVAADPDRRRGEGGLGLRIIDTLAERWGVERHQNYKVVWFETPVLAHP